MGCRETYWCDICSTEYSWKDAYDGLTGLNFTNNTQFKLSNPRDTKGKHLCKGCIEQLKEILK